MLNKHISFFGLWIYFKKLFRPSSILFLSVLLMSKHESQPTQSFSGLHSPEDQPTTTRVLDNSENDIYTGFPKPQSQPTLVLHPDDQPNTPQFQMKMTLKITSTQVVEPSVTTNNSPPQNWIYLDDQPTTNIDFPEFRPFTIFYYKKLQSKSVHRNDLISTGPPDPTLFLHCRQTPPLYPLRVHCKLRFTSSKLSLNHFIEHLQRHTAGK